MALVGEIFRVVLASALLLAGILLVLRQCPIAWQERFVQLLDMLRFMVERACRQVDDRQRQRQSQVTAEQARAVEETVSSAQVQIDTVMEAAARQMRGYLAGDQPTTWERW